MEKVEVELKDIPDDLIRSIKDELLTYFVPMAACSDASEKKVATLGSGTLVKVGDRKFILTAAHVWDECKWAAGILFALKETETSFVIQRQHLHPILLFTDKESQYGPDLALLELSPNDAATIEARKSFLDLTVQRNGLDENPLKEDKGLFAVVGIVGEKSDVATREDGAVVANLRGDAFFGSLDKRTEFGDWDYFDLSANSSLPHVPKSFGGVSGGAVWQINLEMKDGAIFWDRKRLFRGVAFYELWPQEGTQVIRCNGPKALYEVAWRKFDLPI
jgi:hypothetical protein